MTEVLVELGYLQGLQIVIKLGAFKNEPKFPCGATEPHRINPKSP